MYVLWSFSGSIGSVLGKEQFLAMYLSAGMYMYIELLESLFMILVCLELSVSGQLPSRTITPGKSPPPLSPGLLPASTIRP